MVIWVALTLAAWIVLSFPVALVVGRMLAAGHGATLRADRPATGRAARATHPSRVDQQRAAASRWPREARVLCTSRRRVAVGSAGTRVTLR